jgi:hypothetical protein
MIKTKCKSIDKIKKNSSKNTPEEGKNPKFSGDWWDYLLCEGARIFESFIKTRKGQGKEYVSAIGFYFIDKMVDIENFDDIFFETASDDVGWIRSSQIERDLIKQIPTMPRTTLYRLLNEMVEFEILQKKSLVENYKRTSNAKQKKNTYYRLLLHDPFVAHFQMMDRDELIKTAIYFRSGFLKFGELYLGAKEFFRYYGIDDIDNFLRSCLIPWKEYDGELYRANMFTSLEHEMTN